MKSGLFSVLKIAVVAMMLVWGVRTAQAYPVCTGEPEDPAGYSACMSACATNVESCYESCDINGECDDPPDCVCYESCDLQFDNCATVCYNTYCI
jgi:hypothetical protein